MKDSLLIRKETCEYLMGFGLKLPFEPPPLLEQTNSVKSAQTILARAMVIYGFLCIEFDSDRSAAQKDVFDWFSQYHLDEFFEAQDRHYIEDAIPFDSGQVEALYVLAWALQTFEALPFSEYVPDHFGLMLPNILSRSPPSAFIDHRKPRLRSGDELLGQLDVYLCAHWATRENCRYEKPRFPVPLKPYAIRWRRHALEYIFSNGNWSDVELDT